MMGEAPANPGDIERQMKKLEADLLKGSIETLENRLRSRPASGLTRFILESTIRDAKARLKELEEEHGQL